MAENFICTFRGVRGSFPVPGPATLKYGGNTPCVELNVGGRMILLDAGTGLFGMAQRELPRDIDLLLSHTHIDHVIGLPFLAPSLPKDTVLRVWAGHLLPEMAVREAIERLMSPPLFPLRIEDVQAQVGWHDFRAGETLRHEAFHAAGITVRTLPLSHPDRATAYRVEHAGKALCYVTDVEHVPGTPDAALIAFLQGADAMIYDSTYDDRAFAAYAGWGHSTWQEGVRLCEAAGVKRFFAFHHDPDASDAILDSRAKDLTAAFPQGVIAREGMTVTIG